MKIKFIFTGLIVAVLAAVPGANVIAQNDERPAQQDALTAQSTRAERDAERKVRLSDTDLSEARLERTVSRCSVAQNKLATASEQAKQVQRNRTAKYAEISQKLDVLVTRLPEEIDTAELEVSIATYNQLVATLTEGIDQYVIAFSDVASIDCEENTEEFLLIIFLCVVLVIRFTI